MLLEIIINSYINAPLNNISFAGKNSFSLAATNWRQYLLHWPSALHLEPPAASVEYVNDQIHMGFCLWRKRDRVEGENSLWKGSEQIKASLATPVLRPNPVESSPRAKDTGKPAASFGSYAGNEVFRPGRKTRLLTPGTLSPSSSSLALVPGRRSRRRHGFAPNFCRRLRRFLRWSSSVAAAASSPDCLASSSCDKPSAAAGTSTQFFIGATSRIWAPGQRGRGSRRRPRVRGGRSSGSCTPAPSSSPRLMPSSSATVSSSVTCATNLPVFTVNNARFL
jgi:hypothetical protein